MKWSFPSNNNADINGISNTGVETFQGSPLKSLAREICQNSLDAALAAKTVEVEFMPFKLDLAEFPDSNSLKKAFEASLDFWSHHKKTIDFFDRAIKMIDSSSIPFLRVSDFNTSGLLGSYEEYNTPWHNLTKSSGASDKSGTSGGSFGTGKFAPFACSELRTIFYSTLDTDNATAFQGISRITSFRLEEDNEIAIGVGYYGEPNNQPVHAQLLLDPKFQRVSGQTGTDIFISGFRFYSTDWKADIIASVLDGFLYAVYNGSLIVRVEDVTINRDTLSSLLSEYQTSLSENASNYYTVLVSPDTVWYETDFRNHGIIKLGLIIQPEMHRKVAMIRKTGMKILDRGNISGVIPFAGVMLIEGERINDYLKRLENLQHTKWEPDRIEPEKLIPQAKQYIADLVNFIKDCLEKLKQEDVTDEIDPDVGEYLPDDSEDQASADKHPREALPNTIKSFEKSIPPKKAGINHIAHENDSEMTEQDGNTPSEENDSGAGHNKGTSRSGSVGRGRNEGNGEGTNSKERMKTIVGISAAKVRVVCLNRNTGEYSITFVPMETAENGRIDLFLSAESQNYEAPILSAIDLSNSVVKAEGNQITGLTFVANTPVRIKIILDFMDYCAMEVKAYGHKV